jgi:hypothetical protein
MAGYITLDDPSGSSIFFNFRSVWPERMPISKAHYEYRSHFGSRYPIRLKRFASPFSFFNFWFRRFIIGGVAKVVVVPRS